MPKPSFFVSLIPIYCNKEQTSGSRLLQICTTALSSPSWRRLVEAEREHVSCVAAYNLQTNWLLLSAFVDFPITKSSHVRCFLVGLWVLHNASSFQFHLKRAFLFFLLYLNSWQWLKLVPGLTSLIRPSLLEESCKNILQPSSPSTKSHQPYSHMLTRKPGFSIHRECLTHVMCQGSVCLGTLASHTNKYES